MHTGVSLERNIKNSPYAKPHRGCFYFCQILTCLFDHELSRMRSGEALDVGPPVSFCLTHGGRSSKEADVALVKGGIGIESAF